MINIQFNRYMVLVAGIYLMSVSGSSYLFASYSNELQNRFDYNAKEISLIGNLGNVGGWSGIFGGLFYDRFGPFRTTILATIMVFSGYFFIYLAFIGSFVHNYIIIGCCLFLMGQGSSWAYTVALATNCKNFENKDRGVIVGVLVCFYGLCGGIYTALYNGYFLHNAQNFILFMAITFGSVILVFGTMSTVISKKEETEYYRIRIAYGLGITVAGYLAISNIIPAFLEYNTHLNLYITIPLIFMLSWFLTIGVFHVEKVVTCYPESRLATYEEGLNLSPGDALPIVVDMNLLQVIKKVEFWIIFVAFLGTIGSGITTVNNLSNIVISRSGVIAHPVQNMTTENIPHYSEINVLVIMFSIFNTLGRMTMGVAADKLSTKFSREGMFAVSSLIMTFVQIYMAFATVEMMYFGVIVLGLCYGCLFCIVPIIISERFGLKHFGANWGLMGVSPAIGALAIATYLAGGLADNFKLDARICIINGACQCLGNVCYEYTFFITTGVCVVSTILGILLRVFWPHKVQYYTKI